MKTGEWLIALPEMPPVCAGRAAALSASATSHDSSNQYIRSLANETRC